MDFAFLLSIFSYMKLLFVYIKGLMSLSSSINYDLYLVCKLNRTKNLFINFYFLYDIRLLSNNNNF